MKYENSKCRRKIITYWYWSFCCISMHFYMKQTRSEYVHKRIYVNFVFFFFISHGRICKANYYLNIKFACMNLLNFSYNVFIHSLLFVLHINVIYPAISRVFDIRSHIFQHFTFLVSFLFCLPFLAKQIKSFTLPSFVYLLCNDNYKKFLGNRSLKMKYISGNMF